MLTSDVSCPINYSEHGGVWQEVVSSQMEEVTDRTLLDEVVSVVNTLYPENRCFPPVECNLDSCPSRCVGLTVHSIQHPDEPGTIFVAYTRHLDARGDSSTILLRRTESTWTELSFMGANSGIPGVYMMEVGFMGFAQECDDWSLYVGAAYTSYLNNNWRLQYFYRSRDNGDTWLPLNSGLCGSSTDISVEPPERSRFVGTHCDSSQGLTTVFALYYAREYGSGYWGVSTLRDAVSRGGLVLYAQTLRASSTPVQSP